MTAAAAAAGMSAHTVYAVEFEPRFMATSAEFYADEAEEGVERGDAAGYLRNVSIIPPSIPLGGLNGPECTATRISRWRYRGGRTRGSWLM